MVENNEFEADILTLTDEDGVEKDFAVIGDLEIDGNNYLALVPNDEEGDEFVILKIAVDEDGNEMLVTIDDDDEFDKVADAFEDELMEEFDHDGCGCDCDHCEK
ncbi:MAG: DUF1292 domain-containing protein [Ruminococcaceae bacterium]|nr:DUF1292 domain-containing protein [Oscillospiraceae bacterium]